MDLPTLRTHLIQRLQSLPRDGGAFVMSVSPDQDWRGETVERTYGFFTALILSSLQACPADPILDAIKSDLASVLKREMTQYGSVNYWIRNSVGAIDHPYPDDFDSTSCAWSALVEFDPKWASGDRLANLAQLLTAFEVAPGGPYRTWMVKDDAPPIWKDIDLIVNANIAYMLHRLEITLEPLNQFLIDRVQRADYTTPYYASIFPIIYFLSRLPMATSLPLLQDELLRRKKSDHSWGSVMDTALAITALSRLISDQTSLEPSIRWLIDEIDRHGCRAESFCPNAITAKGPTHVGSEALTISFCLEAMSCFEKMQTPVVKKNQQEELILTGIKDHLEKQRQALPIELQPTFEQMVSLIVDRQRGHEIALLPARFHQALPSSDQARITDQELVELGLANVYGWIAYTIYDDILDDEPELSFLPLANACLRDLAYTFDRLTEQNLSHRDYLRRGLVTIDAANAWEVTRCRLKREGESLILPTSWPDYANNQKLADRSFGHAFGPLVQYMKLGHGPESEIFSHLEQALRHYLIARQLDDDAHDWEGDLKRGQLNCVGVDLLMNWSNEHPERTTFHLNEWSALQERFWSQDIRLAAEQMLKHIEQAREHLQYLSMPDLIVKWFDPLAQPIRRAAERVIHDHETMTDFISNYGQVKMK